MVGIMAESIIPTLKLKRARPEPAPLPPSAIAGVAHVPSSKAAINNTCSILDFIMVFLLSQFLGFFPSTG
jgi:hypothetical protein